MWGVDVLTDHYVVFDEKTKIIIRLWFWRQLQKEERQKSRIVLKIVIRKCVEIKLENLYTIEIKVIE